MRAVYFDIVDQPIDGEFWRAQLLNNEKCGGFCSFEGWVRRPNNGKQVNHLIYSAYEQLARAQGEQLLRQAQQKFAIEQAICVHRIGRLEIGDMAVWVGVNAGHRDAVFEACRWIIDTLKSEIPIWKQEFYLDGTAENAPAWLANAESQPK